MLAHPDTVNEAKIEAEAESPVATGKLFSIATFANKLLFELFRTLSK